MIGIQAYVLDFINLSPPWFLLFISPSLRRCVLRMNGIKEVSLFVKVNSINQAPTTTAAATTMTTQASIRHLPIS
uniref:Uncharacterized protein n=1 Tax=Panagrolaimus davidi TaxID=227884 RepID=A0A914PZ96_9BILA